ncbi:MAG: branched-chain amino acid ABC transporter permease [Clostridiales Family XIII bacterium]|jgi:branched-chain amino acid transport system permease protein|nr:branched-chain amino acid ABC transporter permease [Clostridiales Family XIII bacterium]
MRVPGLGKQYLKWILVALIVILLPLVIRDPFSIHIVIMVLFMAYLGMCWNLMGGLAGQFSLGHSAFFGLGAYTSTILFYNLGISPLVGIFAGGIVAAVASLFVGYSSLRLKNHYFALATLAFSQVLRVFFVDTRELFGLEVRGAQGLLLPLVGNSPLMLQFDSKTGYYYFIVILVCVILVVSKAVMDSRLGYYLKATRDQEQAAECVGVRTTRAKVSVGAISAFFTALGGTFYAQFLYYIDPGVFGLSWGIEILSIVIIGGIGSFWGPLLGAIILVPLGEVTRIYLSGNLAGLHLVIYGLVIILVMLLIPKGIVSLLDWKKFIKKGGGGDGTVLARE